MLLAVFSISAAQAQIEQPTQSSQTKIAIQTSCPDARYTLAEVCAPLLEQLAALELIEPLRLSPAQSADPALVSQLQRLALEVQAQASKLGQADAALLERTLEKHYALAPVKERGFFERLTDWWDSLFKKDDDNSAFDSDFFDRLEPSESFARLLFYLLSGLMLAFIAVHGWREVAPLVRAYQVDRKKRALAAAHALPVWPPVLAGISPAEQMARIYSSVVAYLSQRSALPDAPSLTHAEASVEIASAPLKPEMQHDFQALSQQASDSLFADTVPSAEALQDSLNKAHALVQASKKAPLKTTGAGALFVKPEIKPEGKPEAKPEGQPEAKPVASSEAKPARDPHA